MGAALLTREGSERPDVRELHPGRSGPAPAWLGERRREGPDGGRAGVSPTDDRAGRGAKRPARLKAGV